jgi:threonine/homoserine efflux transporter RhtA
MRISPMFGKRSSWPLLLARGCFGSMGMVLYYVSIQLVPLGDAVTLGEAVGALTAGSCLTSALQAAAVVGSGW